MDWVDHLPLAMIGLSLFMAGGETALWRMKSAQAVRAKPADLSAVLDFDVRADTVLGAVMDVAQRAGYRVKANDDIWTVRWTGAYRAKATTFDALADILSVWLRPVSCDPRERHHRALLRQEQRTHGGDSRV